MKENRWWWYLRKENSQGEIWVIMICFQHGSLLNSFVDWRKDTSAEWIEDWWGKAKLTEISPREDRKGAKISFVLRYGTTKWR